MTLNIQDVPLAQQQEHLVIRRTGIVRLSPLEVTLSISNTNLPNVMLFSNAACPALKWIISRTFSSAKVSK